MDASVGRISRCFTFACQVVLSFGIPFALVPMIHITSDPASMGALVNGRVTKVLLCIFAAIIIVLNVVLLVLTFSG